MASVQVLDERMPSDHDDRGPISLQSAHRPQPGLEPAVVGLAPVVSYWPVLWNAAGARCANSDVVKNFRAEAKSVCLETRTSMT